MELTAKFEFSFLFDPENEEPCIGRVTVYLPTAKNIADCGDYFLRDFKAYHLHPLFCSPKSFCDEILNHCWGQPDDKEHRFYYKDFRNSNWHDTHLQMLLFRDECQSFIKEIVSENEDFLRSKFDNYWREFQVSFSL